MTTALHGHDHSPALLCSANNQPKSVRHQPKFAHHQPKSAHHQPKSAQSAYQKPKSTDHQAKSVHHPPDNYREPTGGVVRLLRKSTAPPVDDAMTKERASAPPSAKPRFTSTE